MFSLKCASDFSVGEYIPYMKTDFEKTSDVISDRLRSGLPMKKDFTLRLYLSNLILHVNSVLYHPEFV